MGAAGGAPLGGVETFSGYGFVVLVLDVLVLVLVEEVVVLVEEVLVLVEVELEVVAPTKVRECLAKRDSGPIPLFVTWRVHATTVQSANRTLRVTVTQTGPKLPVRLLVVTLPRDIHSKG